ncbi:MAG: hypothetical protein ACT4NY_05820, partial [Pseudonocardiales bacterium]
MKERGIWELPHATIPLLTVRDGSGHLPKPPLDTEIFVDAVSRRIPGADIPALVSIAEAAETNRHGAMLIISSDAAGEAERMAPQPWTIEPTKLTGDLISQVSSMDGGLLGVSYSVDQGFNPGSFRVDGGGMPTRIFLSWCHQDKALKVALLRDLLPALGVFTDFDVEWWEDSHLTCGEELTPAIVER